MNNENKKPLLTGENSFNNDEMTSEKIEKTSTYQESKEHPNKKEAENAVPPESWENQEKAYDDAWEKNKNQMID